MKPQIFGCKNQALFRDTAWVLHGKKITAATEKITVELQIMESCINSYEGKLWANAADRLNNILDSNIPRGSIYYLSTEMSI